MSRKSVFSDKIFLSLLVFILFEPDFFKTVSTIDTTYLILETISLILLIFKFISLRIKRSFVYWIILFYLPMVIATLLQGNDLFFCLKKIAPSILLAMLIEVGFYYRKENFWHILAGVVSCLLTINVISFVFYPKGMVASMMNTLNDKIYFLSNKNGMISWVLIPALVYLSEYYRKRCRNTQIRLYGILLGGSIAIFYTGSSTGIVGWSIYLMFMVLKAFGVQKFFTPKRVFIMGFLMFFAVNIFHVQHYFMSFFDAIFGKGNNSTFTGREWIWSQALEKIPDSWLLGYGISEQTQIITDYGRYYSAHNFVLDTLLNGGIVALIIFIIMLVVIIKRSYNNFYDNIYRVWIVGLFIFFVCTLTETPLTNFKWWMPFIFAYYGGSTRRRKAFN